MKPLDEHEELTLGSLLRRITDRLYGSVDEIYHRQGLDFQAAWFPVLFLLSENDSMSVTEIADAINQSHSAVSQISRKLEKRGYISHQKGESDRRQRLLKITDEGCALVRQLRPVWGGIVEVLNGYISRTHHDLVNALKSFEEELANNDFVGETVEAARQRRFDTVEIIDFDPAYADAFRVLNTEWLQRYFYVEEIDEQVLSNPEKTILKPGGAILFARYMEETVGTCAMINHGNGEFELTKMGVTATCQGLGIGRKLLDGAIRKYKRLGGRKFFLESNSRLVPAIHLYESAGFAHTPRPTDKKSPYRRSNVYMEYKPRRRGRRIS